MSNRTISLKKQVPDFVSGTTIMNDIYNAQGKELDLLDEYNQDILNQLFVETATWGLSYWEEFFGLPVLINQDINLRRAKIRAHFASFGTVNKATIKRIAADFGFVDVDIIEDYSPYIVKFIFDNSNYGDVTNINDLLVTLKRICPAHIDFMYVFLYKSWKEIHDRNITFEQMEAYQWRDYTVNYDTSTTVSPILRLKLWNDGDLFSMLGFNYNFDRIDSHMQNHTHNGIDSKKLTANVFNYSSSDTLLANNTFEGAITRLSDLVDFNKDGLDKERFKTLWGYTGESDNWEDILQHAYRVHQNILESIRSRGVRVATSSPLKYIEGYIRNIFTGLQPWGTATPRYVREGKTFISKNGVQTGTAKEIIEIPLASTTDISVNGYAKKRVIVGDENLISSNIKKGVTIFGVTGSAPNSEFYDGKVIEPDSYDVIQSVKRTAIDKGLQEGMSVYNQDGSTKAANVVGGCAFVNYDKNIHYSMTDLCSIANITYSTDIRVTHIIDENHIVIQDVVNKNMCKFIQLPGENLNITFPRVIFESNKHCISTDRFTYDTKPWGEERSRQYLLGFVDCIYIIDTDGDTTQINLPSGHSLVPNTAKAMEMSSSTASYSNIWVTYSSISNGEYYICKQKGSSLSSLKAKDLLSTLPTNQKSIKVTALQHTKQKMDKDSTASRKILVLISYMFGASSEYVSKLVRLDANGFSKIDEIDLEYDDLDISNIAYFQKDTYKHNYSDNEQNARWTITALENGDFNNGSFSIYTLDNNFKATNSGFTYLLYPEQKTFEYILPPKMCEDSSYRGIFSITRDLSGTYSPEADAYRKIEEIPVKIRLK